MTKYTLTCWLKDYRQMKAELKELHALNRYYADMLAEGTEERMARVRARVEELPPCPEKQYLIDHFLNGSASDNNKVVSALMYKKALELFANYDPQQTGQGIVPRR